MTHAPIIDESLADILQPKKRQRIIENNLLFMVREKQVAVNVEGL